MSAMGLRAVFLVGFMGSGKSTVGQELARRLAWDFVDLDARIEAREGQSIPEIFRGRGEPAFRTAETAALRELIDTSVRDSVVALGGGAFVAETNRDLLRSWPSVFLDAPVSELWRRCLEHEAADGSRRPLRNGPEQFAQLHEQRLPFYRQAALTVQTSDKNAAAICEEIERGLQLGDSLRHG
jgi:shikimate kinase